MEDYLINNLSSYIGKTDCQLKREFGIKKGNNKSTWIELAYNMAGVTSNSIKELKDENIVIKIIRINNKGKIKESMSFPTIKFSQLVKENWEDSYLYNYFKSTKFLFVIYRKTDFEYTFLGGTFWKMPHEDLNLIAKKEWQDIQDTVRSGLKFEVKKGVVLNNLPKKSQTEIIHLRPKANKSAYSLNNGFNNGDIKKDGDQLPNGEWMTKQCFWLNNDYVLKQIEKKSVAVKHVNNSLGNNKLEINLFQQELLKKHLNKEFYMLDEFKQKFLTTLNINDEKYINALNIDKLGFRFNFTYVYSSNYNSINKYIESILLSEEIVDLREAEPKLLEIYNIEGILDELIKTLPVMRIQRNVFINKGKLSRGGINQGKLKLFEEKIVDNYFGEYFTIDKLRINKDNNKLFEDGFENCFYEDILIYSNIFKSFLLNEKKIFCGLNHISKISSFLEYIVNKTHKVEIADLKEILLSQYGLDVEDFSLKSALRFSCLYFNQDIEKVYANHDEFVQEVKESYL